MLAAGDAVAALAARREGRTCPEVEIDDSEVRIGGAGNLVILKNRVERPR